MSVSGLAEMVKVDADAEADMVSEDVRAMRVVMSVSEGGSCMWFFVKLWYLPGSIGEKMRGRHTQWNQASSPGKRGKEGSLLYTHAFTISFPSREEE